MSFVEKVTSDSTLKILTTSTVLLASLSWVLAKKARQKHRKKNHVEKKMSLKKKIQVKLEPVTRQPLSTLWQTAIGAVVFGIGADVVCTWIPIPAFRLLVPAALLSSSIAHMVEDPQDPSQEEL